MTTLKRCSKCKKRKNVKEFTTSAKNKDGLYSYCHSCNRLRLRQYKKQNPLRLRNWQLKQKYNINLEMYEQLLKSQNKACAICKTKNPGTFKGKNFFVDHCHKTGKVRGLLCINCNKSLPLIENKKLLNRAIRYLNE